MINKNNKIQNTKKFATTFLALAMMVTQSGCLIGFILPPVIVPLTITGTLTGIAGGIMVGVGTHDQNAPLLGTGAGLMLAGGILDQENPGQMDALNPISRDKAIAQELGVTLDDITDYNDNLNPIRQVALDLSKDIQSQLKRSEFKGIPNLEQLSNDSQIDTLARKYGFNSGREFVETFKAEKLSQQALDRFAQATQLSAIQAKILLRYGFAVNSI